MEKDIYLFHRGEHRKAYQFMGAHPTRNSVVFRTWAPNAKSVSVVGDFNSWNGNEHRMNKITDAGIWEIEIEKLKRNEIYKYEIETLSGEKILKADPYAFYSELRPNTASVVHGLKKFSWGDKRWLNKREVGYEKAINIYEVHLASWRKGEDGELLNYKKIADKLVEYVQEMKYTHIELMPIMEHPLDASWGYQCTGYYSVTSRYGDPEDFKYLVNLMHKNKIGVILDWVPGHFCKDAHGLYRFDGTPTYEYADTRIGENRIWGTANFDISRFEVKSFLISNLIYWIEEFHIDGFRMDAVANLLYFNAAGLEHEIIRDYGSLENKKAVAFLKHMNSSIHQEYKDIILMAEDSTAWPLVTRYPEDGGLGFDGKWNMGWMNDTLSYMEVDPFFRKNYHSKLTFSFMYSFSENYILPLSHDEVVHGKKSILNKMPGYYEDKLNHVKNLYSYQIAHPGKKLNFMGNEFVQGLEWRFYEELEWNLLKENKGSQDIQKFVKYLNELYLNEESFHYDGGDGFEWIEHENHDANILIFMRKTPDFSEHILAIFNFSGADIEKYKIGVPENKKYRVILNSDDKRFGGKSFNRKRIYTPKQAEWNHREQHIEVDIAGNSAIFIKIVNDKVSDKN